MRSAPPTTWPTGLSGVVAGLRLAPETQLVGACLHRADHPLQVLVEVDTELVRRAAHLLAVDRRRKARLLELLLHGLRREADDAGRPHQRAGTDKPRQLVDSEQRLRKWRGARMV